MALLEARRSSGNDRSLLLRYGAVPNFDDCNTHINGHSGHSIHWAVTSDFNTMLQDNPFASERIVRMLLDIFESPDIRPTGPLDRRNHSLADAESTGTKTN
ncbi:hypothetical protein N7G274_001895 [Stereocaulon virgatum]|uniref:Uncharacterized protein n=1 Tax=Stereocaulon virgatum TaxID=373712 RepID=A0ABR4ASK8_9LECA